VAALVLSAAVLAGCATTAGAERDPRDPLEGMNRAVFSFNEGVDAVLLKPAAQVWQKVTPQFLRTGVDNFFSNLGDLWSAANHLLQGKPVEAMGMTLRFGVNTTLGLAGLLDVAGDAGLERQREDFGQTLGRWGLGPGPYLVLPLLGPSTVRDGAALPLDMVATSSRFLWDEPRDANGVRVLQLLNTRAGLLDASRALDEAALDKYILLRDGFLARRRNQVYDGDPPEEGAGTR
jgi:phospholipid-binding lipoprotein MlaA